MAHWLWCDQATCLVHRWCLMDWRTASEKAKRWWDPADSLDTLPTAPYSLKMLSYLVRGTLSLGRRWRAELVLFQPSCSLWTHWSLHLPPFPFAFCNVPTKCLLFQWSALFISHLLRSFWLFTKHLWIRWAFVFSSSDPFLVWITRQDRLPWLALL